MAGTRELVRKRVEAYRKARPRYERLAETLDRVLSRATRRIAPMAIVQARAKTIPSFAGKILAKWSRYSDPLAEMTDLAGVRVIAHTADEVDAVCEYLGRNFDVDWDNCVNAVERLKASEFGYRSIHYIVSFRKGEFPDPDLDVEIPDDVRPGGGFAMKAEVQVRTIFEHAWADIAHDLTYKSAFPVPERWSREIAVAAALLEEAGSTVERTIRGLSVYAASYGDVLSPDEVRRELETQEAVLEFDPENADLAARIGKLAITIGDWDKAIEVLRPFEDSGHVPAVRDLGLAVCKKNDADRASPEYARGRALLEAAAAPEHGDVDALCCLAGTLKEEDPDRARELYRRAHELDPSDPYPLVNFLVAEMVHQGRADIARLLGPTIRGSLARCDAQIEVGMNLPWAHLSGGLMRLLLGEPYESLASYARGIRSSSAAFMVETSLRTLDRLRGIEGVDPGLEWCETLLRAGLAARFGERGEPAIPGPVAIVAGGCREEVVERMRGYRDLLLEAFGDCGGTIVSGGTTSGIPGVVGEVAAALPSVRAIGYVPGELPDGVERDDRYDEIRATPGVDFTPLEALTGWTWLLESGVDPADVRVLGFGGGRIAAAEYRIALALGARVAVVRGSGDEAARIVKDPAWADHENLFELPADVETLRAFLCGRGDGIPGADPEALGELARAIHEDYRSRRAEEEEQSRSRVPWHELSGELRDSNLEQAADLARKLGRLGYRLERVEGREPEPLALTEEQVEVLARMEHARWTLERLGKGWSFAPEKNVEERTSPWLVGWDELPDEIRDYDRQAVRLIPELLARLGLRAVS